MEFIGTEYDTELNNKSFKEMREDNKIIRRIKYREQSKLKPIKKEVTENG